MTQRTAWAAGLATFTPDGQQLDAWFPSPSLQPAPAAALAASTDEVTGLRRTPVSLQIDLDEEPRSISDAYLRLQVLSHRLATPGTVNLTGLFELLPNNVWTNFGPLTVGLANALRPQLLARGTVFYGVDRFPRLLDYLALPDVRIADADRVRLGAHLAPGTVVMHEGFVNFNAGTLGVSMVEGRISQGVVVEAGSDIGGGASIMGTLSGGGKQQVRIGRRTLLGANAGTGISLGDDVIVEAGLYLTAGTKVQLVGFDDGRSSAKALELSGADGILFRRNSVTGAVEAVRRNPEQPAVELNSMLH